jgi:RNA polymerase sigma-70 factor (ECF subfamily)
MGSAAREATMDRSLVEQAQRGDREAFTSLAFELSDNLFAVAHRILRDFDSAGDALQVTLLHIWRDLRTLRDPDLILPWSYRILVRACNDQLRKQRRRASALYDVRADRTADDVAVSVADRDELARAFGRLSTEHRAALVLQVYRDMTIPQIAEVLHVPAGTVQSRLHYARRALRAAIEADARQPGERGTVA